MKRSERARRIGEILDSIYPAPPVPLEHRDPFTLLVAVLLSAQTTDAQVNRVTPGLFARAATPAAMAELDVDEIHSLIRTCGLAPTKAKNLSALTKRLMRDFGGEVPRSREQLETLPGVGHKTAGVVVSQAFGIPAFAVDTHIHRLAARWRLSNGTTPERTEQDLQKLYPPAEWSRRHLQFIYFGREYCPARGHERAHCPVCSWAAARPRHRSTLGLK